ncbi:serine hydrolase domain-containing protein [Bremerella alba]|uniref:serine hydrolase domain-containing protein n=1 Tax=Bremerella alba TaxID=980252 RepID=UPI001A955541|nr:serine hydrolase domain-containing protein [Bremerella alba]
MSTCYAKWPANQDALVEKVEQIRRDNAIPGVVVLLRNGDHQWLQAFGVADLKTKQPMQTDMAFRAGSNTKTMTATVILQLVQEGKLKLEDKVSKFFDNVPQGDEVTIADLLDMRSGIANYSEIKSFNQTLDEQPDKTYSPQQLIQLGIEQKAMFKPGSKYFYSNTNYVMLGVLIERMTEMPLEEVFQQRIFTPLKLTRTSMPAKDDNQLPPPFAHGYMFGTNVNSELTEQEQKQAVAGKLLPSDMTLANPSWAWAAGAAISTADDLADYVEVLIGGGLLDESMQAKRLASIRPANPDDPQSAGYGLGIAQMGPMIGHDGSLPGYQSFMGHDPKTGLTMIVLTNLQDTPGGEMAANVIAKDLIQMMAPAK